MAKTVFITGTGTDVGKTYVAGLLLKKLVSLGKNAAYFKAAMSGNERREDGTLIPGDALMVKNMSGIDQPLEEMCPYVYESFVSPHLASRIEGNPVKMDVVKEQYQNVAKKYDYIVVEGSGGIVCPIGFDEEKILLEDIMKELRIQSVLVADAGLGTINSVVLTAEYMKQRNLPVKAVIFNHFHQENVMEKDNLFMCEHMTGIPVVSKVKDGEDELSITEDELEKLFEVK